MDKDGWLEGCRQGSKYVFESGHQFGHLEERLVTKLPLVFRSEINKLLISLLRPFPRLSCLTLCIIFIQLKTKVRKERDIKNIIYCMP